MRKALIEATLASLHDCTQMKSVTGVDIDANVPAGGSAAFAVKVGNGKWRKFADGAWADLTTQKLTADSLLAEGNTQEEIEALGKAELTPFVGMNVYFAVALASGDESPSIKSITVNGISAAIAYKESIESDVYKLSPDSVAIVGLDADKAERNGGTVDVYATFFNNGEWSEYKNIEHIGAVRGKAVKFKSNLVVTKIGTSTARLTSVQASHHADTVTEFSEGTCECVTIPFNFVNDISEAHLIVKHGNAKDNLIKAYIAFHRGAHYVQGERIATGAGRIQIADLAHTENLAGYGFKLYFDGEEQDPSVYWFSPQDGQVTFNAPAESKVTCDYIYGWSVEDWHEMGSDIVVPDKDDPTLVSAHFDYAGGESGTAGEVKVELIQQNGTETEALGIANGDMTGYTLSHKAKPHTISVTPSNAEWTYNESTNILAVRATEGSTLSVTYDWYAGTNFIESLACVFNQ